MRTQKVGNLSEPFVRTDRERRALVGMEGAYEITRTGLIWSLKHEDWVDSATSWPFVKLVYDDQLLDLNLVELIALTWLSPEQRDAVRTALGAQAQPWSAEILATEQDLGVPVYAIAAVSNTESDANFGHWGRLAAAEKVEVHKVNDATVESYNAFLFEHHRPPSKGGNTRALHTHVLTIAGATYSFFALGAKKWVFAGDTTSFSYRVTPTGFRNVVSDSLVTTDKNGKAVVRGLRGKKLVLRTAPARMPVSRREQRD